MSKVPNCVCAANIVNKLETGECNALEIWVAKFGQPKNLCGPGPAG